MITYLGWGVQYPFLRTLSEVIYYGTIISSIVVFLILAGKRLLALGYPKNRVVLFTVLAILITFPAGYFGSRAASMFYRPIGEWSAQLFFDSMLHGVYHTYHASLLPPLVFGAVFCYFLRLRFLEVFDSIYLYIPLAHAFGRLSCLLIGCCWGNRISMDLFGLHLDFQNPMPLYAILANVCIFQFLRQIYTNVYSTPWTRERFRGVVLASYFLIYAMVRIVFDAFRREPRIFLGLTQAQMAMGAYIGFSIALFLIIILYRRKLDGNPAGPDYAHGSHLEPSSGNWVNENTIENMFTEPGNLQEDTAAVEYKSAGINADKSVQNLYQLFSAAGITASYLIAIFLIYYLTHDLRVWQWPFQPVKSVSEAYSRILSYLPAMLIPAYALFWLKKCQEPIRPWFKWNRFSYLFLVGLAVSIYYSVELLILKQPKLRGIEFWPPVIIMSIMNALAEEIMYRLALYRLLIRAHYSNWVAQIAQSLVYSLIHFMIAGAVLGLFSLLYGFILGLTAQRSKSITPAIICHFIIDIGCIGLPLLRM